MPLSAALRFFVAPIKKPGSAFTLPGFLHHLS